MGTMAMSMLDFVNEMILSNDKSLTKSEFADIRRHGTVDELEEAVEKMEAAGGYDNLSD